MIPNQALAPAAQKTRDEVGCYKYAPEAIFAEELRKGLPAECDSSGNNGRPPAKSPAASP